MQSVQFFSLDRNPRVKDKKKLKRFINKIFVNEGVKLYKIIYIFCSDDYIIGINKEFLKHNFYTDVVTFDLSSQNNGEDGEVYISIDRVKDNARYIGTTFIEELHRVIFHGALHLCGYKDKKKNEVEKMRAQEEKYLELYFN